jgi:hypothetical protein
MTKIYYRWTGNCKYEFYIDTGVKDQNGPIVDISLMITINIIGGGKVSNKRGRLKKRLMSPPPDFVIGTGETWCRLNEKEKKYYLDLTEEELKEVLTTYELKWTWQKRRK